MKKMKRKKVLQINVFKHAHHDPQGVRIQIQ